MPRSTDMSMSASQSVTAYLIYQKTDSLTGIGWLISNGGEGGIRTHVGLHPNGFQDRPVMTASVPLQDVGQSACSVSLNEAGNCPVIIP